MTETGIIRSMLAHRIPWEILAAVTLAKALGIIPGAIAAFWVRHLYQKRRQSKAMDGWPVTEARVHSVHMRHEGRRLWFEITYSYFVGEYRSGTYIRRIRNEEEGDDLARAIRNKSLPLRYDPTDPDKSVILDRELEMSAPLAAIN